MEYFLRNESQKSYNVLKSFINERTRITLIDNDKTKYVKSIKIYSQNFQQVFEMLALHVNAQLRTTNPVVG